MQIKELIVKLIKTIIEQPNDDNLNFEKKN
jgi:hypothetical protein